MRKYLVFLLVLVLACGASWFAATRMVSPDQAAARARPPEPVPVTARLQQGFLHPPVTMSAGAQFESVRRLRPPAALTGTVTAVGVAAGQTVTPGTAPLRVDGRPLFLLPGSFQLYRDLSPGDEGDDVAAVQGGLQVSGFGTGRDRRGTFGPGTRRALERMYDAAGFRMPTTADPAGADPTTVDPAGSGPAGSGTAGSGTAQEPASEASAASGTPTTPAADPVPVLPRREVFMTDVLPATVEAVAGLGSSLSPEADLFRLGAGAVVLTAQVPAASLGALQAGAVGALTADGATPGQATLEAVEPVVDSEEVTVRLWTDAPVAVGTSYVVAFDNPANEAAGRVLAPVTAVVTRAGHSFLYLAEEGEVRELEVVVEDAVGGMAAVRPVDPEEVLAPDAAVRVGDDAADAR